MIDDNNSNSCLISIYGLRNNKIRWKFKEVRRQRRLTPRECKLCPFWSAEGLEWLWVRPPRLSARTHIRLCTFSHDKTSGNRSFREYRGPISQLGTGRGTFLRLAGQRRLPGELTNRFYTLFLIVVMSDVGLIRPAKLSSTQEKPRGPRN